MARVDVKMVCGACGTGVRVGMQACGSCGAELVFPQGIGAQTPERKKRKEGGEAREVRREEGLVRRKTEPWMIIASVAVLALIGFIVFDAVQAPTPIAPSAGPAAGPAGTPMMGGGPDLRGLEDAVRMRPADHEAQLRLANGYHDAGRWEEAVATYSRYLSVHPEDPDARVDMGICYFEWSKRDPAKGREYANRAVAEMKRALKEHPKHQAAAFNLGIVTLNGGDAAGAAAWFRRAAEMDGSTPLGQKARAMLEQHSFTN